jgi:hypothetical protein
MSQATLTFDIKSTDYSCPFGITVWDNNQCVFQLDHVAEPVTFSHEFDDEIEQDHEIKITISGKKSEHTVIDQNGNIVSDVLLIIDNFVFDNINIDQFLTDSIKYYHNGNGTLELGQHQFYNHVGCNGDLIFSFSTPMYLWLLERL